MGFPDAFYQQNLPSHAVTVYLCLRGQATKKEPRLRRNGARNSNLYSHREGSVL